MLYILNITQLPVPPCLNVIFKKEKQQKQEVETDTVNGWYCRVVGSKILLTSINKVSKIMLPHVDM